MEPGYSVALPNKSDTTSFKLSYRYGVRAPWGSALERLPFSAFMLCRWCFEIHIYFRSKVTVTKGILLERLVYLQLHWSSTDFQYHYVIITSWPCPILYGVGTTCFFLPFSSVSSHPTITLFLSILYTIHLFFLAFLYLGFFWPMSVDGFISRQHCSCYTIK